ncbi:hypothetical protein Taro_037774, partial [Colocasia esculenta]|nr:hypothetical protein [Colocasia esculenta]
MDGAAALQIVWGKKRRKKLWVDGQVWSLTGLASIQGDVNLMNLTSGFVDIYCDGSLSDIRVDANLCDLQNIGLPEDSSLTLFSLSLTLFSHSCFPTASNGCRRSLRWQIEEIGVVEEMIQRRALSVWSLTGLASIQGDVNLMNLMSGFVDVYCDGSLSDIRVDANLCDLQNIGLPEDSSLTLFSLSLALFSHSCFPTASNGCRRLVGGSWNGVTSRAFRIHADRVCCGCGGRCEASVNWLCGMYGVDVWFAQFRVAVPIGGIGVDANLRILQ